MSIVWQPQNPQTSRMWHFMRFIEEKYGQPLSDYHKLHEWSIQKSPLFWQALCQFLDLQFDSEPTSILNDYDHMMNAQWFTGATLNFAEKLLQRTDSHPAIIAVNEQGERHEVSYAELRQQVAACAAGLRKAGIGRGDRVAAVLPNVPQTIIAFLATASLGAIWSSCSPDFGIQAAVDRLGQVEPKVLFINAEHQYQGKHYNDLNKVEEFITKISSLSHIVVCTASEKSAAISALPKAIAWDDFIIPSEKLVFTSLPFSHPLYILFSSGTTGQPKCIIHSAGGSLIQHMKELALHTDISEKDNLCFYTTCGWMMWNWMVSILSLGATLTLYEGSPTYPDANRLFELIDKERITVFGTSAKFLSAVEKANLVPKNDFSLQSLRCILSTGSPLLPKNYDFVYEKIKSTVQLSSISGGTDIVSCFALGNPLLPVFRGEIQCLGLGMSVEVFDEEGHSVREKQGELVCTKPFPSMPVGFWNDRDNTKYHRAYFERFPGLWAHGDFAEITGHNSLIIYGRSDAVLNPGGVRIGTAEIYRQVEKISAILDSVVIGQNWDDDVRIVLFVKLRKGVELEDRLLKNIRQTIRDNASPRHVPAKILQVPDIPKTISGKVVELAVRAVVHNQPVQNLSSLANPESLEYFKNLEELQKMEKL